LWHKDLRFAPGFFCRKSIQHKDLRRYLSVNVLVVKKNRRHPSAMSQFNAMSLPDAAYCIKKLPPFLPKE